MYNERPPFDTAGYGLRRAASRAVPSHLVSSAASGDPTMKHAETRSSTLNNSTSPAVRRPPAWAAHVRTTERVGCLSFHELEAAAGDFPLDAAASASFVLTMPDSSRNESLTLELLERLRPTRRVFVVENPGYKACPKPSLCKNASNFDLIDTTVEVFRYARAHLPNTTVLVLEDDFFWAADELLSTAAPGPLTRSRLAAVASFVAAHASEIDHYSLGCVPAGAATRWSANDPDHLTPSRCIGSHAVLHTPAGMAKFVDRLERDPCFLRRAFGEGHIDMTLSTLGRFAMYRMPLAYQTFTAGTANYDAWPVLGKAALSGGMILARLRSLSARRSPSGRGCTPPRSRRATPRVASPHV